MLCPIPIILRPRTTAETVAEIRTHIAAIDALANGIAWNSNDASRHADAALDELTAALESIETARSYEDAYNDAADNDRVQDKQARRNRAFMASERYP